MNGPLSESQVKELDRILKLPKEKQQEELNEFLSTLSPEQIEYLKGQQQCVFCLISEGKMDSKRIYEDEFVLAVFDINPANVGHLILLPKRHYKTSFELSEDLLKYIFSVANVLAKYLMRITNAAGINLFVANGQVAGQKIDHFIIHIIPRFKDDGLDFSWSPKKFSEEELIEIQKKFKELMSKKAEKKVIKEYREERIP